MNKPVTNQVPASAPVAGGDPVNTVISQGNTAFTSPPATASSPSPAQGGGTDWEAAYKGMQRNYNALQANHSVAQENANQLSHRLSTLEQELAQLRAVAAEKENAVNTLTTQQSTLSQSATAAELKAAMLLKIASEYPELGPIAGNLQPLETAEATNEMLKGMHKAITDAAAKAVQQRVGGYNPEGSVARTEPLSTRALAEQMARTAGTSEYEKYASQFYRQIQESGNFPKPAPDPLDASLIQ